MDVDVELWGAGTARTLRPIWMAEELGIAYKLYPIEPRTGETKTPEFTMLNPKQKIPVLKHDNFLLSESVAICRYLQRMRPSTNVFVPNDNKTLALEDEWCNFIYGELDETSLYIIRRHQDLKNIYGDSPEVVQSCRHYFEKHLQFIEERLDRQNSLFGCDFGLADILLVSCLDWAQFYEFKLPKNISKYYRRITSREAYKKAFAINFKNILDQLKIPKNKM